MARVKVNYADLIPDALMRTDGAVVKVTQVDYHRNGVGGNGFYAVLFTHDKASFVATVFAERGNVAVLRVPDLSDPEEGVTFAVNSWRGDHFETALRRAILAYNEADMASYGGTIEADERDAILSGTKDFS